MMAASIPADSDAQGTGPSSISGEKHARMHGRTLHVFENPLAYGAAGDNAADDTAEIQAALDALPATGGTVLLSAIGGGFKFSALTMSKDNVTLAGDGLTPITVTGAATNIVMSGNNCTVRDIKVDTTGSTASSFITMTGTDGVLEHVAISAAGSDDTENGRVHVAGSRCAVVGCHFTGGLTQISSTGPNQRIEGNVFELTRLGIYLHTGSDGAVIRGNRVLSIEGSEVTTGFDAILCEGPDNFVIADNLILASREHAIYCSNSATNGVITGNTVHGHGQDGIKILAGGGELATNITIAGNTVASGIASTRAGINVGISRKVTITGNTIIDENRGIYIRGDNIGLTVSGNHIERSTGANILVTDVSGGNSYLSISGNICANADYGGDGGWSNINVKAEDAYTSEAILITNNLLVDNQDTPTTDYGITFNAVTGGATVADIGVFGNYCSGQTSGDTSIGAGWTIEGNLVEPAAGNLTSAIPPIDGATSANVLGPLISGTEIFDRAGHVLGLVPLYGALGYTPYEGLAGLVAWYDAQSLPGTDGEAQTLWLDLTPNAYHLVAGTSPPIFEGSAINGHQAVRFSGATQCFMGTTYEGSPGQALAEVFNGQDTSTTVVMVVQFLAATHLADFFTVSGVAGSDLSDYTLSRTDDNKVYAYRRDPSNADVYLPHSSPVAVNTPTLIAARGTGTSYDLTVLGTTENVTLNVDAVTMALVDIGGTPTSGGYANMDIGQLLIYDHALSDPDLATVIAALETKWGL